MKRRIRWEMRYAMIAACLLLVLQGSHAQENTIIVRRDLLPEVNTSIPAAVDSAMRCGLAGLPAAGIALLEQPLQSVRGNRRMEALIAGLQAGMYSELGMMQQADDLYARYRDGILALPYAP